MASRLGAVGGGASGRVAVAMFARGRNVKFDVDTPYNRFGSNPVEPDPVTRALSEYVPRRLHSGGYETDVERFEKRASIVATGFVPRNPLRRQWPEVPALREPAQQTGGRQRHRFESRRQVARPCRARGRVVPQHQCRTSVTHEGTPPRRTEYPGCGGVQAPTPRRARSGCPRWSITSTAIRRSSSWYALARGYRSSSGAQRRWVMRARSRRFAVARTGARTPRSPPASRAPPR